MSSSATPHGARPVGTVVGSPYQGKVTHYKIKHAYATSIFYGDFVILLSKKIVVLRLVHLLVYFLDALILTQRQVNLRLINIFQLQRLRMILLRMLLPIRSY